MCIGRYESQSQITVGRGWVGIQGPLGMKLSCMGMFAKMQPTEVNEIVLANMSRYYRIEDFNELGFHKTIEQSIKIGYGTYDHILLDRTTSGFSVAVLDPSGYPIAAFATTYITDWLSEELKQGFLIKLQQATSSISTKYFYLINYQYVHC